MPEIPLILRALKVLIVILGSVLVYLGAKGYLRTKHKGMLFLSLGFTLITAGSFAAGILFEFLGFQFVDVSIVESIMVVIGFGILIYSIYGFD